MLPNNDNVFLDTNVIIGYIFCLDNLNPYSKNIVTQDNNFYYSYHVNEELKKVYMRKRREFDIFFSLLLSVLMKFNKTDFLSLSDFHLYVKKFRPINKLGVDEMQYTLDYIWKFLGFGENQEVGEIIFRFNRFISRFHNRYVNNKYEFKSSAYYIPSHNDKDKEILHLIEVNSLDEKLHGEDENILFDLHEFNENNPISNVILVSWDRKFMEVVEVLIDKLSFDNYLCLRDVEENINLINK